jgi:hypothetical protein
VLINIGLEVYAIVFKIDGRKLLQNTLAISCVFACAVKVT